MFFLFLTVNIAVNKPAHQYYPWRTGDDRYDANNAVDGRKSDLSWHGGQCAVSSYGNQTAVSEISELDARCEQRKFFPLIGP